MLIRLFSLSTLTFFLLLALKGSWVILLFRSCLCLLFFFLESYQGRKELRSYRFWYSTGKFVNYGHVITFAQNLSRLLFFFKLNFLSFILIRSYTTDSIKKKDTNRMVEPLLSGIVLGLIPVTISGLFVTAYLQYRRGDQLNF